MNLLASKEDSHESQTFREEDLRKMQDYPPQGAHHGHL